MRLHYLVKLNTGKAKPRKRQNYCSSCCWT